jgi:hypothetical protein
MLGFYAAWVGDTRMEQCESQAANDGKFANTPVTVEALA